VADRPPRIPRILLLTVPLLLLSLGAGAALSTGPGAPRPAQYLSAAIAASPITGALPLNVSFSATPTNGTSPYSYAWSFGDGTTASTIGDSVYHVYTWISRFQANVTITDYVGEVAAASVNVTVTPTPLALTLVALPSSIAAAATTYLEANASGGYPPYTYSWSGLPSGCVGANVASLACTPTYGGGFTVTVAVHDRQAGNVSASAALVVSGSPEPTPVHPGSASSPTSTFP
jgi:hypothetical protein